MKVSECKLLGHCEIPIGKSVTAAAKALKSKKEKHIYVTKKKVPMGVISSIDLVYEVMAKGKNPGKTKVEDIMKYPIHACELSDTIVDAYFKMAKLNLVAIPVLKGKIIKGVLTSQEILKHFVKKGAEQ